MSRNPSRNELVRRWINQRFSSAQQKANDHENDQCIPNLCWYQSCCGSENTPPDNTKSQDASWTKAIRQSSARSLKQRIAEQKRTEDVSKLNVIEMICVCNGAASDRDVHAIEKRDHAQDKHPEHEHPANATCLLGGHSILSGHRSTVLAIRVSSFASLARDSRNAVDLNHGITW